MAKFTDVIAFLRTGYSPDDIAKLKNLGLTDKEVLECGKSKYPVDDIVNMYHAMGDTEQTSDENTEQTSDQTSEQTSDDNTEQTSDQTDWEQKYKELEKKYHEENLNKDNSGQRKEPEDPQTSINKMFGDLF